MQLQVMDAVLNRVSFEAVVMAGGSDEVSDGFEAMEEALAGAVFIRHGDAGNRRL